MAANVDAYSLAGLADYTVNSGGETGHRFNTNDYGNMVFGNTVAGSLFGDANTTNVATAGEL
jgi:hypothetical protein